MTFGIIMTTRQRVCYSILTTILLVLYLVLGAVIFVAIEEPYQNQNPAFHIETLNAIISNLEELKLYLGNSSGLTISEDTSLDILDETSDLANDLLISEKRDVLPWNLQTGIHFCMTAVTTIGYGYIAPSTQLGRFICIPYILLGIPLNIFLSANLGFFIAQGISKIYSKINTKCKQLCSSKGLHQNDYSVELNQRAAPSHVLDEEDGEEGYCQVFTVNLPERRDGNHFTPIQYTTGAYSQEDEPRVRTAGIRNGNASPSSTSKASSIQQRPDFIPEGPTRNPTTSGRRMDAEEECICPLWFILLMLLPFCSAAALIVYSNENGEWTFLDAFYFTIVSFTTVGFGDMRSKITRELGSNDGSHKWGKTIYTYAIMEVGLIMVAATLTIWSDNVKTTARSAKKAIKCNKITRQIVSTISQCNVDTPENRP